jgi:hypothetical protein
MKSGAGSVDSAGHHDRDDGPHSWLLVRRAGQTRTS